MTRKEFLQSLLVLGFATAGAGTVLSSCGGGTEETAQTSGGSGTKSATKPVAAAPCTDVSGLTEAELTMRNTTLKYVTQSTDPNKRCDNCKFWTPPEAGQTCGGCQLIKGPIHPKGNCSSWFTQDET